MSALNAPRLGGTLRAGASSGLLAAVGIALASCASQPYDPARATRPYPRSLHATDPPQDVQVFREGHRLRVVNATTRSYRDAELWINQRYVMDLPELDAGATVVVSMSDLWDRWGGSPSAGGFLRRNAPTPVRMAELELEEGKPLIGLIVIRSEDADIS